MVKIGRGSQMGAWHQEGLADWVRRNITLTSTWEDSQWSEWVSELMSAWVSADSWISVAVSCFCENVGSSGQWHFGNSEEGERSPLEADAKLRLVKTERT
jgi:hypothetical protein